MAPGGYQGGKIDLRGGPGVPHLGEAEPGDRVAADPGSQVPAPVPFVVRHRGVVCSAVHLDHPRPPDQDVDPPDTVDLDLLAERDAPRSQPPGDPGLGARLAET